MSTIEEVKFCKDCAHYRPAGGVAYYGSGFYWEDGCMASPERDLVTGERITWKPRLARAGIGNCGPEAKLWKPKPEKPPERAPTPISNSYAQLHEEMNRRVTLWERLFARLW